MLYCSFLSQCLARLFTESQFVYHHCVKRTFLGASLCVGVVSGRVSSNIIPGSTDDERFITETVNCYYLEVNVFLTKDIVGFPHLPNDPLQTGIRVVKNVGLKAIQTP